MNNNDPFMHELDVGKKIEAEKKEKTQKHHSSPHKDKKSKKNKAEELIESTYDNVSPFLKKYAIPILLTICIILAVGIRLHAAEIPLMDQWAEESLENSLRQQITADLTERYQLIFSQEKVKDMIEHEIKEESKTQEYQEWKNNHANELRESYQDPNGDTYLLGIDPYHYYDQAQKKKFESFLPVIEHYSHKIVSIFNKDVSLVQVVFYLPILFAVLIIITLFFIVKKIAGTTAAFISSLFISIHPEFLAFSFPGLTDTNALNILFTLLIALLFLYFFEFKLKTSIIAGILLIPTILLFKYTWSGYYSVLLFIVATIMVYYLLKLYFNLTRNIKKSNRYVILAGTLILIIFSFIIFKPFFVEHLPEKVTNYMHIGTSSGLFPDTLLSIAELRPLSISELVFKLGGNIITLFALIGLITLSYTHLYRKYDQESKNTIFIIIISVLLLFSALNAIRFLPFFIPFFLMLFGIGFSKSIIFLTKTLKKWFSTESRTIIAISAIVMIFLLLVPITLPLNTNLQKTLQIKPITDDAIYNAAVSVKEYPKTSSFIIFINAWWDKGYILESISDTLVLQRGYPQTEVVYLQSLALTTNNETLSAGINHALYCDADILKNLVDYDNLSNLLTNIKNILGMTKEEYEDYVLKNNIYNPLKTLFCENYENMFIILTDDLALRFNLLQHYASWDPVVNDAASIIQGLSPLDAVNMIQETYNTTQTEANNIYIKTEKINTIQTPPIDQYDCLKSGSNAICRIENYDFVINTETMEATYKNFYPLKFYFVENGNVYLNEFDTPNPLPYVLIMYERAGNYHAILVDEETSESIFIKMLYLEGYGLTKFEKVYEYVQPETKKAVVYRLLPKTNSTQNDNQ